MFGHRVNMFILRNFQTKENSLIQLNAEDQTVTVYKNIADDFLTYFKTNL
jgi:hypothetical protein